MTIQRRTVFDIDVEPPAAVIDPLRARYRALVAWRWSWEDEVADEVAAYSAVVSPVLPEHARQSQTVGPH